MDVCLHYAFDSVPSISSYIQTSVENVVQQNLSASPPDYGQMGVNVFTYLHKNNYTKHHAPSISHAFDSNIQSRLCLVSSVQSANS